MNFIVLMLCIVHLTWVFVEFNIHASFDTEMSQTGLYIFMVMKFLSVTTSEIRGLRGLRMGVFSIIPFIVFCVFGFKNTNQYSLVQLIDVSSELLNHNDLKLSVELLMNLGLMIKLHIYPPQETFGTYLFGWTFLSILTGLLVIATERHRVTNEKLKHSRRKRLTGETKKNSQLNTTTEYPPIKYDYNIPSVCPDCDGPCNSCGCVTEPLPVTVHCYETCA
jgi:hypothetical protein